MRDREYFWVGKDHSPIHSKMQLEIEVGVHLQNRSVKRFSLFFCRWLQQKYKSNIGLFECSCSTWLGHAWTASMSSRFFARCLQRLRGLWNKCMQPKPMAESLHERVQAVSASSEGCPKLRHCPPADQRASIFESKIRCLPESGSRWLPWFVSCSDCRVCMILYVYDRWTWQNFAQDHKA